MTKDEIRKICEKRFMELGAERIELQPSGKCWTLNGEFFKVTMPYDISETEVLEQVNSLLLE